jgi:RNA recognition motif-containing protein
MNVPYDAYKKEIEDFVRQFVAVEEVVIPKDRYSLTY